MGSKVSESAEAMDDDGGGLQLGAQKRSFLKHGSKRKQMEFRNWVGG